MMECVLNNYPASGSSLIRFEKKDTLYVNESFNKIDRNLAHTITKKGETWVVFDRYVIVSVTEMDFEWMRCKDLCFIREDQGKEILTPVPIMTDNKFRNAMINWNELGKVPKITKISKGLDYAIAFEDEFIIMQDARRCWIVKKELMEKEIFPAMPPPEQERERIFWVKLHSSKVAPELNEISIYNEKPNDFDYKIITRARIIQSISGPADLPKNNFHYIEGNHIFFINKGKSIPASLFRRIRNF